MAPPAKPSVELELAERQVVAAATMSFRFRRPPGFDFKAGQSADFTIPDPVHPAPGPDPLTHTFSLASSPANRDTVMITSRMRDSDFKHNLRDLPLGSVLQATRPSGRFTLPDDRRPVVMLAGGIGITPFRSMLKEMLDHGDARQATLFYSNPTPADAAFLDDLQQWSRVIDLDVVATVTRAPGEAWPHERGRIDAGMVRRHLDEHTLRDAVFYVAGPPAMVDAMAAILREADVTEDRILHDEFTGY